METSEDDTTSEGLSLTYRFHVLILSVSEVHACMLLMIKKREGEGGRERGRRRVEGRQRDRETEKQRDIERQLEKKKEREQTQ